jgi:hypothetical protein
MVAFSTGMGRQLPGPWLGLLTVLCMALIPIGYAADLRLARAAGRVTVLDEHRIAGTGFAVGMLVCLSMFAVVVGWSTLRG